MSDLIDMYEVVYPGDPLSVVALKAMGEESNCEFYVALWVRDDGQAIFGRCWRDEEGKCKASFPFEGREVMGEETKGWRVLIAPSGIPLRYFWAKASEVDPAKLVYCGASIPAVVHVDGERLGQANWDQKVACCACSGTAQDFTGPDFDECHLLCKEPIDPSQL